MPLSLACIAGEARAAGAEVRLYDAMSLQHTHDDIAREMESFAPDIVGTGAYTALEPDTAVCAVAQTVAVLGVRRVHATWTAERTGKRIDTAYVALTPQQVGDVMAAGDDIVIAIRNETDFEPLDLEPCRAEPPEGGAETHPQ